MTIREYIETDWPYLCEIHDLARKDELKSTVGLDSFLSLAETYENEGLFKGEVSVASYQNNAPVGFVAFAENELTWLYVHPHHYQKGIGKQLLRHAIQACQGNITTEVLIGNDAALNLYAKENFVIDKIKSGKLEGNEKFAAVGALLRYSSQPALNDHFRGYKELTENGFTLLAIDLYYADTILQIENGVDQIVGKKDLKKLEADNLAKVIDLKITVDEVSIDATQQVVTGYMTIYYTTRNNKRHTLRETFMQQWQNGKIVKQFFTINQKQIL